MTPKSNLPEGRVNFNVFQPAAIAQISVALAVATSKSAKSQKDLRTADAHIMARSGLFGSRKMTPKSNLPKGRVNFNVFGPTTIAQISVALAVATTKSANLQKDLRTADAHTTARFRARARFQNVPRTQA